MTREEAIETLGHVVPFATQNGEKIAEAIDMAIEALMILGGDGIVNCCGCIHWKTDGGAMMMCELWDTPMDDFDYCSYGKRNGGDTE